MELKENSELKRFLKKLAILLMALIFFDFSFGHLLEFLFFKGSPDSTTYVMNETKADFLVFGSSRAAHHYVPELFKEKLHTSFFNCGHDSYRLIYHLAVISAVLERYKPKYIVLEIEPDEFATSEENSLSMLLPYQGNPGVRPFLKYNSKFENIKLLSKLYPYNSLFGNIVLSAISSRKKVSKDIEGYGKFTSVLTPHPVKVFQHGANIRQRVGILDNFLAELDKKAIKITLVISPAYYRFSAHDQEVAVLQSFCKKYKNVHFINYENAVAFTDYRLFQDDIHMNDAGARKFSADLAAKLADLQYQTCNLLAE